MGKLGINHKHNYKIIAVTHGIKEMCMNASYREISISMEVAMV